MHIPGNAVQYGFLENYILQLVTAYSRFVNLGKFSYLSLHNDAVHFAAMGGYKTTRNFNGRIWNEQKYLFGTGEAMY